LFTNPFSPNTPSLWGLPVADTNHAAMVGNFLTGSFADAAQIFDREDANVVISTENADDFEKNMISIRCEERLALAVYRPEAFVKGAFPVPAP
jgi:HK97 family phage major capsid protein